MRGKGTSFNQCEAEVRDYINCTLVRGTGRDVGPRKLLRRF